jgi:hypothetical protein
LKRKSESIVAQETKEKYEVDFECEYAQEPKKEDQNFHIMGEVRKLVC